jgi:hypothetical protein
MFAHSSSPLGDVPGPSSRNADLNQAFVDGLYGLVARNLRRRLGDQAIPIAERAIARLIAAGERESADLWLDVHAALVAQEPAVRSVQDGSVAFTSRPTRH